MDLNNYKTIDFDSDFHVRKSHTGKSSYHILSQYPETLFDPRPFASHMLKIELDSIGDRKHLLVVFSSENYKVDYQLIERTNDRYRSDETKTYSIYDFSNNIPTLSPKFGKEIIVSEMGSGLKKLFEKYKVNSTFNQTFSHPTIWETNGYKNDEKYFPFMTNMSGEIVSYAESDGFRNLIILPQIKDKTNFLIEFFEKIAPSIYPELFPSSTTVNWREQKEYWLPQHSQLLQEKSNIQKDYETKLVNCDAKIEANKDKYSFLHNILTETGDKLVTSIIEYLKWLGFDSVIDYDKRSNSTILEEDIQVELSNGLLVIECKGINTTSKDEDCSQVYKIKNRRREERGKFDVFALYIVNHQRQLPPLNRRNPPFSEHQVQDAKNDKRGLLSTWKLFCLYSDIEKGILTKEEARKLILNFGLVDFRPKDLVFISKPVELFKDNTVCIVNIENLLLTVNDELLVEKNGKFEKAKIKSIQDNGVPLTHASIGEFGLELNKKIPNHSTLWKRIS
jgi:hypothetical protein